MLAVETMAKVRRLHFVQGLAIKAICRELGLSRKVVRKVLLGNALRALGGRSAGARAARRGWRRRWPPTARRWRN